MNKDSKDQRPPRKILCRRGEKIRRTKAGLVFSGPSAYLSQMHYAPITLNNIDHDSNEQAYQFDKAIDHGLDELATAIKNSKNSYEIKDKSHKITTTLEWENGAPGKIRTLIKKKFEAHPELLERLLDTYPLPLIEGSGGSPIQF